MADKGFGVKEINLIGASGTPTIESPNNINLNAVNVAISTDASIGGQVGIADTIFHIGDTNTKIRFPAADTITAETGGSERLRILSGGEVLIGGRTAKPNDINKLVVTGTSPADAYDSQLYLEGSETSGAINTGGALAFGGHDGGTARNWANIYGMKENGTGSNYAAYMSFHTRAAGGNPAEKMRITSAGKVVIRSGGAAASDGYAGLEIRQDTGGKHLVLATNSATSSTNEVMLGFKLHPSGQDERVKAAIICRGTGSSDYGQPSFMSFCLDNVGDNGNATVANDEKLRIDSSGQMGLGMTPGRMFEVKDSTNANRIMNIRGTGTSGAFLAFLDANTTDDSKCRIGSIGGNSIGMRGDAHHFQNGAGTDRMVINTTGGVGIGTNNFASELDNRPGLAIHSDSNDSCRLMITTPTKSPTRLGYFGLNRFGVDVQNGFEIRDVAASYATRLLIDNNGQTTFDKGAPGSANQVISRFQCESSRKLDIVWHDSGSLMGFDTPGNHSYIFKTNGTERARIRNDGFMFIQATSSTGSSNDNIGFTYSRHNTSPYIRIRHEGNGSSFANHTLFHMLGYNGTLIGEIKQTGGGGVNYYSASDHRLKENIADVTNAITRLKNLKPKRFNFKVNADSTQDGFLAHELQEVIPDAVSGTKDEVVTADSKANNPSLSDSNIGDPVYQGVDERRVVPLLTAALQEAIAKIEILEAEVAALKSS